MTSTLDLVDQSTPDLSAPKKRKTLRETVQEKLKYTLEVITVEPLISAYVMAAILCIPALFFLEFEKACRVNLAYDDSVCDIILYGDSENYTKENDEIQIMISNMHSWQQPLQSVMPLILILFLGSYSDRHKLRKPFLIIPLIGELISVTGCILCVVFMKQWPLEAQGILQTVLPSFFGGQTMVVMATFAYIADVSSLEMRTLRIGIIQISMNIVTPVAQAVSGVLFTALGYIGILSLGAALYVFGIVYAIFWIKEPKTPVKTDKGFIADAFDPKHALETFKLLLKKTPGNNRLYIVLVLFILFIYSTVNAGESSVFYLYVQGIFQWGPVEYSYCLTINTVVHFIGTAIGVPLLSNYFKMTDLMILFWTFVDKIVANVVFGLAKTVSMLYTAIVVSIITGLTGVAIRSLATKIVSEDDLGKAQSLFGICEALGPAVAVPIYNTGIYINTLDTFPAAYFFFGAILYAVCIPVVFWMYFQVKKSNKVEVLDEQNKETNGTTNGTKAVPMEEITHM